MFDRIIPCDVLRRVLLADAVCSAATGLLSRWFGLPIGMLREVGPLARLEYTGLRRSAPLAA